MTISSARLRRNRTRSRRALLPLGLLALLTLAAATALAPAPASVGRPAPSFSLQDLDGRNVSLSSLRGKVVVLDFWATWCRPCVSALKVFEQMASSSRNGSVEFLAVNVGESDSKVRQFMSSRGWDFKVLLDQQRTTSSAFGVGGIPHVLVIDRSGTVAASHVGFRSEVEYRDWLNRSIDEAKRR